MRVGLVTQPRSVISASQLRRASLLIALLAILGLCAALHLYRLGDTPGWDSQEGYNLDIAWNLAHGRLRLFALSAAFAQHPPLFYLQLALAIRIVGYNMLAVRAVAALYAILTCAAVLLLGRRLVGSGPALWAGIAFCIAPLILANTRWGYSYAQLAFVGVLCLWATWRYTDAHDGRWLLLAAALAGLAAFSDYEGLAWIAFVALVAWRHTWRDALRAVAIGLGLLALGLFACFLAAPGVFLADAVATLGRAGGGNFVIQTVVLLLNYYHFVTLDAWVTLGIVGLFFAPVRVRGVLLAALATLALVVLKVRAIGPSIHTLVPLLPLLALGMGLAIDVAVRSMYTWTLGWLAQPLAALPQRLRPRALRLAAVAVVFLVVASPLGLALASDAVGLNTTLATRQDATLAAPNDASAVASYIRQHAQPNDLILASPEMAWMFDRPEGDGPNTSSADLLQTVAQGGHTAAFYPGDLPAPRWAYSVALSSARYVIVDDLLRQLAQHNEVASLAPVLHDVTRWPIAYSKGQYTVYARPNTP